MLFSSLFVLDFLIACNLFRIYNPFDIFGCAFAIALRYSYCFCIKGITSSNNVWIHSLKITGRRFLFVLIWYFFSNSIFLSSEKNNKWFTCRSVLFRIIHVFFNIFMIMIYDFTFIYEILLLFNRMKDVFF